MIITHKFFKIPVHNKNNLYEDLNLQTITKSLCIKPLIALTKHF